MPFLVELSSQYTTYSLHVAMSLKVNGRSACTSFAKMASTDGFRISWWIETLFYVGRKNTTAMRC
jgi:hypothetical protein